MLKVGVLGAHGKMGSETCKAVAADPELELVAEVGSRDPIEKLVDAGAEVAVELTTPSSVKANVLFCIERRIHAVVGATGLAEADLAEIERLASARGVNVFVAPNFALGAVLMMRFSAMAARLYDHVEIVERHHEKKLDAPSGTSMRTARLIEEARGHEGDGVPIHSLRLPGSVAHQEVIFGGRGETLTIRHDSIDRTSFMPGVLLAIKRVRELPGLTVGLEHLL